MKCDKEQTIEKLKAENERLKEQLAVIREMATIDFALDSIVKLTGQFLPKGYKISKLRFKEILKEQEGE